MGYTNKEPISLGDLCQWPMQSPPMGTCHVGQWPIDRAYRWGHLPTRHAPTMARQ